MVTFGDPQSLAGTGEALGEWMCIEARDPRPRGEVGTALCGFLEFAESAELRILHFGKTNSGWIYCLYLWWYLRASACKGGGGMQTV